MKMMIFENKVDENNLFENEMDNRNSVMLSFFLQKLKTFREKFEQAMDDDINTADAISVLFDFIKYINKNYDENTSKQTLTEAKKLMDDIAYVLGILFKEEDDNLDSEIEDLIEQRNAARKEKDFKKADEIRDKLLSMGIVLKDTRDGVIWERSN